MCVRHSKLFLGRGRRRPPLRNARTRQHIRRARSHGSRRRFPPTRQARLKLPPRDDGKRFTYRRTS